MKIARSLFVLLLALALATPAWAQDSKSIVNEQFGVTVQPPKKWEVTQGNDKAVANFKHPASQSQIEVVGTKLMTKDVANVFFTTFHKTLKESQFEQSAQEDKTIGEFKGKQTTYKFTHSGVTLSVLVFEFVREDTAWLVVGYIQDSEEKKYATDFEEVVKTMKFKQG